jgi:UDP-perosamine 4-acetyltransferase
MTENSLKPKVAVLLGTGGHAAVLLEILGQDRTLQIRAALTADTSLWGCSWRGIPVLGGDDHLPRLSSQGVAVFINGLGSSGNTRGRHEIYLRAVQAGLQPHTIIHPAALVAPSAQVGAGCQLLARCLVNTGANLANNVIINTGAIVEHDCTIGESAHVASGAVLCGNVSVGAGAHIGANASVRQGLSIAAGAIVGIGAVVTHDVAAGAIVVGNPARELGRGPGTVASQQ